MLSILIPVYNYNITPLISNLHDQLQKLHFAYEILVIDDCSSNQDITFLNKEIDTIPGCTYIFQENNLGRVATRLQLAQKAQYDWLLFLDADVLPKRANFIEKISRNITIEIDMIFGGIEYESKAPENASLRWIYGQKKEVKNLKTRKNAPYSTIISQNFVIRKELCLQVMKEINFKRYGLDILFSYELEKRAVRVLHIDNPTVHLGLEDNDSFIKKSIDSLETSYHLQQTQRIPDDYRPVQRAYKMLKRNKLTTLFYFVVKKLKKIILKNLKSNKPSIILFDVYRLYYFIKIQKEA